MRDIKRELEQNGFVVLEDFLSVKEVEMLKDETQQLIKDIPEPSKRVIFSTIDSECQQNKDKYFLESSDKISYFFESEALEKDGELKVEPEVALNKIGHALHELNPVFRKITLDERVKETCFQLGFSDPAIVQSMYIFKNPGLGSEVTAHQDATYLYADPLKLVGFWIALDDATIENGCLWFSKGSHKGGVHRRYIRNPDPSSDELLIYDKPSPYYQKSNFVSVPVTKGTCILIDGQIVHFSESNRSKQSRHAYTFHVIEQKNSKYAKNNWIQPPKDKSFLNLYTNI